MRFVSMTLALLVGVATASTLRLGDYCEANTACESSCCWYGVCRASFQDCSAEAQNQTFTDYNLAITELKTNLVSKKIVSFAKAHQLEATQKKLQAFIAADMKKRMQIFTLG